MLATQTTIDDWSHVESDPDSYTLREQKRIVFSIMPVIFERAEETHRIFAEHDYFIDDVHFTSDFALDDRQHYSGHANLYTDKHDPGCARLTKALSCFAPCFTSTSCVTEQRKSRRTMNLNGLTVFIPDDHAVWHVRLEIRLSRPTYHGCLGLGR